MAPLSITHKSSHQLLRHAVATLLAFADTICLNSQHECQSDMPSLHVVHPHDQIIQNLPIEFITLILPYPRLSV